MKIVVLAGDDLKKEMPTKAGAEWVYIPAPADFMKVENADAYFDLEFEMNAERIALLAKLLPAPVFINAVVPTLAEIGRPFIRINAWPGFLKRPVCEAVASTDESRASAKKIFDSLQWNYQLVPDTPGMVSTRVIAMIINEAYYAFQENISSKEAIDTAMKLGTNYPFGPFEWSKQIGLKNIYALLLALQKTNPRYTIAGALIDEAAQSDKKS